MDTFAAATEDEVADAVRTARGTRTAFEIVGAGSKRKLARGPAAAGTILDVSGLSGIVKYEPDELIVTVRPGTGISELEAALAEKGQRLGFEPADWGPLLGSAPGIATVGGAISCDVGGSARVRYGAVRDHLLGIRAVNGLGEAFKAGGKVVKNVTGFDIPKLVCGAFGTLCVLTEVTLRVFPRPPRVQTFAVRGTTPEIGLAILRRVWSSPLEATGLAWSDGVALIRLDGDAAPLSEKSSMLKTLCAPHLVEPVDEDALLRIASGEQFVGASDPVWRAAIPPANAAALVGRLSPSLWTADWAGSLLWVASKDGHQVRAAAGEAGGHAVLMRADEQMRAQFGLLAAEDPVRAQLTRMVKAAFDPLGLFNPGRMWDGL